MPGSSDSMPDLRLARVETMFTRGQWKQMKEFLASQEKEEELPPILSLFLALAKQETNSPIGEAELPPHVQAINAMEGILGVPRGNPLALFLGKRLTRKALPITQRKTSWKANLIAIAAALAIGGGGSWFFTQFLPRLTE